MFLLFRPKNYILFAFTGENLTKNLTKLFGNTWRNFLGKLDETF
jgi:hypothetical protein